MEDLYLDRLLTASEHSYTHYGSREVERQVETEKEEEYMMADMLVKTIPCSYDVKDGD